MTNNTLKSTIEAITASNALLVVTLDGTFNSQTGAPVLSARTRPDQRNKFLKDYCERVNPAEAKSAQQALETQIDEATQAVQLALDANDFASVIANAQHVQQLKEQADQPRVYYRIKPNVDLRTVAEKRAAKKAENEAKRAAKAAEKAEKMAAKAAANNSAEKTSEQPAAPPAAEHSAKKGGRR
jgi:colicin import membrane protein